MRIGIVCYPTFGGSGVVATELGLELSKRGHEIHFVEADVYDLPFEDSFDYIYCRFLFQHLSDPIKAISSLKRALKPGGILHILDVNDEWLFIYPEIVAFNQLKSLAITHQGNNGGNRLVGKALRNMLLSSGLNDVQVDLIPVHSDLTGMKTFIEITTRFKKLRIDPEMAGLDPDRLLDEIDLALQSQDHFGMVGVFSVSGKK